MIGQNKRAMGLVVVVLSGVSGVLDCTNGAQIEPAAVTLCAVVADPEKYDGKLIRVTGSVVSDGIEHLGITDKSCGDKGISVTSETTPGALDNLSKMIFTGTPGTSDKEITATFDGTFHWRPGSVPSRLLAPSRVTNVRMTRRP